VIVIFVLSTKAEPAVIKIPKVFATVLILVLDIVADTAELREIVHAAPLIPISDGKEKTILGLVPKVCPNFIVN
jgi:hypothetical protein